MTILNPALKGFYETKGIRNYVLYGGRGSSKTYHTAGFCVFLAMHHRVKFLCVRQFQNRVSDSVKTVIEECIYALGKQNEFRITETGIEYPHTGSTFKFLGIQRNLKEIKGTANIDVLWIEEAEDLGEEQWEVLEPTIRAEHSKIFIVFNPRLITDFVYKRFITNPPKKTLRRKINYDENPYLSNTLKDIIQAVKAEDEEVYRHIYLGEPRQNDEDAVIKRSWLIAAIDAHKTLGIEPTGVHRIGFDVADSGEDKCAQVFARGQLICDAIEWKAKEDELLKSCTRVWQYAREQNAVIVYDAIGVGASSGAKFNELNAGQQHKAEHVKFFAGGGVIKPEAFYGMTKVKNKDMFANIKAQAWWLAADKLKNTFNAVRNGHTYPDDQMLFIDGKLPNLDKLIDELSTPKRDYDGAGRVKVESKKDLAKRDIASPNLADAFIMTSIFTELRRQMKINPEALKLA